MVRMRVLILTEEMKTVAIITFMPKGASNTCIMCQMHHNVFQKNTDAIIFTNLQTPKKKLN